MWKIQSCEVCEFCILLYYARKSVTTFRNVATLFRACIIGDITRLREDMDFMFEWQEQYSEKVVFNI